MFFPFHDQGEPLSCFNGNLTFMESGSVGGYIIKKIIEAQERQMTYVFDGLKRPSALRDSVLDTIGACHQWYVAIIKIRIMIY